MIEERAFADEAVERFTNDEAVERANKAMRLIIDAKHERGEAVDLGEVAVEAVCILDPDDIRGRLIVNRSGAAAGGLIVNLLAKGSDSLLVQAAFLQRQHPSAEQVDTGAAIHRSL